jgi:hypothetical protein
MTEFGGFYRIFPRRKTRTGRDRNRCSKRIEGGAEGHIFLQKRDRRRRIAPAETSFYGLISMLRHGRARLSCSIAKIGWRRCGFRFFFLNHPGGSNRNLACSGANHRGNADDLTLAGEDQV